MLRVRPIESFDLPELQPYRTMRRQMEHRQQGLFVAEGEKVVRRLLESGFTVVSVLLPEKWLLDLRPLLEARTETIDVFVAPKKLLETLTGFSMYQGLLALGKVPRLPGLLELLDGATGAIASEHYLEAPETRHPLLLVAAEGLSSAENMGLLVRNCAAFSAHGLIVGETCSSPFLRRAVRSSMGTIFQLPIVESPSLVESLRVLRKHGVRCIAAHPRDHLKPVWRTDFTKPCCIVFGSEGYGISTGVLNLCDEAVAIPMRPTVDSLNVGSAAAAFLYEAVRQRSRA